MANNAPEDDQLWTAYRACSQDAIHQLFTKHHQLLWLKAYGFMKEKMKTEDVIQETLFSFLKRKRKEKEGLPLQVVLPAYIGTSVFRAALHQSQKEGARQASLEKTPEPESAIFRWIENALWLDVRYLDCILEHIADIAGLSPSETHVWCLSVKGNTPREIVEEPGQDSGSVRVHKTNAFKKVKAKREEITIWLERSARKTCAQNQ